MIVPTLPGVSDSPIRQPPQWQQDHWICIVVCAAMLLATGLLWLMWKNQQPKKDK